MATFYPGELPPELRLGPPTPEATVEPQDSPAGPQVPARPEVAGRPHTPLPTLYIPRSSGTNPIVRWVAILCVTLLAFYYFQGQREQALAERQNNTLEEIAADAPLTAVKGATLEQSESYARHYTATPDADGSYLGAARDLAWMFGIKVYWSAPDDQVCNRPNPPSNVVAWYCGWPSPIVILNSDSDSMPEILYDQRFVDTIKHELSHHSIYMRCRTTRPGVAGEIPEGVTNSYAVLFLNANKQRLTDQAEPYPEYHFGKTTDAAARSIYRGDC